jgi:phosphatidylserine decarboxylase
MTQPVRGLGARLFVALQYVLPQHLLSALMYRLARLRWRLLKNLLIATFLRLYRIDMSETEQPDAKAYRDFNAFFTRALRPDARPMDLDPRAVVSPVDGRISQSGPITASRLIQAKGRDFTVEELLGGDPEQARVFIGGTFVTIYLAPSDYHRIHMPLGGDLAWMRHIPGRLFSVNNVTADLVPRLFARNERVACRFETDVGAMAMVLVGAIFVGGIETVWAGEVTPAARQGSVLECRHRSGCRSRIGPARARHRDGPLQSGLDRDPALRAGSRAVGRDARAGKQGSTRAAARPPCGGFRARRDLNRVQSQMLIFE